MLERQGFTYLALKSFAGLVLEPNYAQRFRQPLIYVSTVAEFAGFIKLY